MYEANNKAKKKENEQKIHTHAHTSTGENDSRIINVYWNAVDHLSNISFSVASSCSLLLSFAISRYLNLSFIFSLFFLSLATYRSLFRRRLLLNRCEFIFLMLPLHVFTVCMSPREFPCGCCCCCHFTLFRRTKMTEKSIHSNLIQVLCSTSSLLLSLFVCE